MRVDEHPMIATPLVSSRSTRLVSAIISLHKAAINVTTPAQEPLAPLHAHGERRSAESQPIRPAENHGASDLSGHF